MSPTDSKVKKIADVTSMQHFKTLIEEPRLTTVHFWASWANQCEPMDDAMKVMAEEEPELSEVQFLRVEAEERSDISMEYQVAAVPTFLFFRAGQLIDRVEGAKAADVTKAVKKFAAQKSAPSRVGSSKPETEAPTSPVKKLEPLESRLKKLISASKCMIFMKGDPAAPKCGFSRQTVELLNSLNAEFGSFDILTDEEVRQGLKTYSNWPTYPQLYVDGELVGGLDILKEMHAAGDLESLLPKKQDLNERLKKLVNKSPVMIFMKGSGESPKCGFSRQLMEILQPFNIPFETFDILEDEDVRQGLKKFSNWPTYPQVYVKGELIGGLDIVKDLHSSGELEATLKGQQ